MTNTSLLLVEGKSEESILKQLCPLCGIETNFEISPQGSLDQLKTAFKTYLKSTNTLKKVWIIIDADTNFENAWQSIRDIITRSGKYSIDKKLCLPVEGVVITPSDTSDITVGIWIMPNNKDVGMLENFLLKIIPNGDSLHERSIEIIEELEKSRLNHIGLYKSVHKSKAQIHTWLAWQDSPGESLGVAVQKQLFNKDADLCCQFTNWLSQLNY